MKSFAEFESAILAALPQERSDLQGFQGASEAQLSAWVQHLFQQYLGYTYKEILHGEGLQVGSKGGKQLFTDLHINILDNGVIFIECKRLGLLGGPGGQKELASAVSQLKSYILMSHLGGHSNQATIRPKTVLGVVTDGNRWVLIGLTKTNEFHTIAEWTFLTDDPQLIAKRLWLLAKPALAQPTSALVEFLARRRLAEVLEGKKQWLTKQVNDGLPGGAISKELIGRWLREAFADPAVAPGLIPPSPPPLPSAETVPTKPPAGVKKQEAGTVTLADVIQAGVIVPPLKLFRKYKGQPLEATLLPDGKVGFRGVQYDSCSNAASAARQTVVGKPMSTNGWDFWQYRDEAGKRLCLNDARSQLIKTREGQPDDLEDTSDPERYRLRLKFWEALLNRPKAKGTRHANITVRGKYHYIGAGSGVRGLPFNYVIREDEATAELYIDRGAGTAAENKDIFDRLHQHKAEIERDFGGPLSWQRLNDKQGCRIAYNVTGGYRSDESKWPAIQDAMIDAMGRLEKALTPHLEKLKTELTL
jgi:hypothetical protein